MDDLYGVSVLRSVEQNLPRPPRSTELLWYGLVDTEDNISSEDEIEDYILPDNAVSIILSQLPIKDTFRFGFKLSKNWLELWKENPLVLHDAQLLPDLVRKQIMDGTLFRYNVANRITHILDLHPGPVEYMRLEYTSWKGGSAQIRVWVEKLIRKGINELMLFGRWPQADMDILPNNITHLCQLKKLTLCFFKIPELSIDDAISFTDLRDLIVVHCKIREIDISILLLKCCQLNRLSFGHITIDCFTISSASLSVIRLWNCRIDTVFILNCPDLESFIQLAERDLMQETQIHISSTPSILLMSHLYLDQQTLYVDGHQIAIEMTNHPQYESLMTLSLGVKFVGNVGLDVIRELLVCFPNLRSLTITRMDPEKRHSTALIKWRPLLQGVRCVEDTLVHFHLYNSGLDDCEIDLAQAMLLCAAKLKIFVMLARDASDDALRNLETVIYGTDPASQSIMTLELGLSSGDP